MKTFKFIVLTVAAALATFCIICTVLFWTNPRIKFLPGKPYPVTVFKPAVPDSTYKKAIKDLAFMNAELKKKLEYEKAHPDTVTEKEYIKPPDSTYVSKKKFVQVYPEGDVVSNITAYSLFCPVWAMENTVEFKSNEAFISERVKEAAAQLTKQKVKKGIVIGAVGAVVVKLGYDYLKNKKR